jgi:dihydroorotate dehydrogenase
MTSFTSSLFHFFYTKVIKNLFFSMDPEFVHNQMTRTGILLGRSGFGKQLTQSLFAYKHPSLTKKIDGITFPNPVGLSAGFDYNGELTQILPSVGFGFHTIGTITLHPYAGNHPPRLGRLPNSKALIVNKGLKNIGAKVIIKKLEQVQFHIPTGISIASTNKSFTNEHEQIKDILSCFLLFEKSSLKHTHYELNISCPNTFGGEPFTTPQRLERLLKVLDQATISKPVYIKMPIDQSLKESLALLTVINKHNVQGVVVGNLTKDKTNSAVTAQDKATWQRRKGNLSGKPTWERSNQLIELTKKKFKDRFTIIGVGGIFNPEDARYKIKLGADLVALITGMIYEGPQLIGQINYELAGHKHAKNL